MRTNTYPSPRRTCGAGQAREPEKHGHRGLSFADYVYWMPALLKRNPAPKAIVLQLSDVSFETSLEGNGANYFRKTENGSLELVHRAPDPSSYEWENPWWSYLRLFDYAEDRIYRFRTRARHGKSVKADPPLPDETVPL